ncbi:MAG TPA: ABC transporter permease [Anaerolineales bacterium]|nr:ABC transporter permease [Anaerolineales bacterium]
MRFAYRILWGSLRHQRGRLSIAALAIALGSALVSGLLNLSGDIRGQVGRELRAYGANLMIRPVEQSVLIGSGQIAFGSVIEAGTLAEADLEPIKGVEGVVGVLPYLYSVVEVGAQPVVLVGTDLLAAREVNAWWQVRGRWPETADEVLLGVRAAQALSLELDEKVAIRYGGKSTVLYVVALLETGWAEDEQLVMSLDSAQTLSGQLGRVNLVMVSALASQRSLDAIAGELQEKLPSAKVKRLAQFASAETEVLNQVRLLMGLVAALVLVAGAVTVAGTLNILVIERRAEIGLMKALGAANWRVAGSFLAETLIVGALGGLAGYLSGLGLALAIGQRVFATTITPPFWALPGTLLVGLVVTWMAALFPVGRALRVVPVRTLRGE